MNVTTKRGNADNVITYEHICDTMDDLANINPDEITLGSVAIVLQGDSGGLEVYIADSNKQWKSIAGSNLSGGSSSGPTADDTVLTE